VLLRGDCLQLVKTLESNSIDAIVTDPPYELGLLGKSWDSSGIAFNAELWQECLRILKPGGYLLAFSGSRTVHRMAQAIECGGFEIVGGMHWTYGSGFPKGNNISKTIDRLLGVERTEVIGGAYKVPNAKVVNAHFISQGYKKEGDATTMFQRFAPASEDAKKWDGWNTQLKPSHEPIVIGWKAGEGKLVDYFPPVLYVNKPSVAEKNGGLEHLPTRMKSQLGSDAVLEREEWDDVSERFIAEPQANFHPTVKPIDFMRTLIALVSPYGGKVFDPFLGSGTTAVAASLQGRDWVGCELTPDYWDIIEARVAWAGRHTMTMF